MQGISGANRGIPFHMIYLVALALIAALVIALSVGLYSLTETQEASAAVLNVSGRQGALSQRSALLALALVHTHDAPNRDDLRGELGRTVDLMARSHHGLIAGDAELGLPPAKSGPVRALHGRLDAGVRAHVATARALLLVPDGDPAADLHVHAMVNAALGKLLTDLNGFVSQVQHESEEQTRRLQRLIMVVFAVLAAVLAVSFFAAQNVTRKMGLLSRAAAAIAEGRLDEDHPLPLGRDEVGRVAETFKQMTLSLKRHTEELTNRLRAVEEARKSAQEAREAMEAQLCTIESQRELIRELSIPVLPLTRAVLMLPLIGALDEARLRGLQSHVLGRLAAASARYLIMDVTAVPVIDTQVAGGLLEIIAGARLMGVEVIVVGIRSDVARTIVSLGVEWKGVVTASTLERGIEYALATRH